MAEILANPVVAIVVFLGLIVFVHELGHFVVGRALGLAVEVFSIGFGPRLFGFNFRGTEYQLSWIPLGGYVKFAGAMRHEDPPPQFRGKEYYRAAWWRRLLTLIAGPAANVLLAFVIYTVSATGGVKYIPPVLGLIQAGSPAEQAGLLPNDRVVMVAHEAITTWSELQKKVAASPRIPLPVKVKRGDVMVAVTLTPAEVIGHDQAGRTVATGRIGVSPGKLPALLFSTRAEIDTGDVVTGVSFGGTVYPVATWDTFLSVLTLAYRAKVPEITLDLRRDSVTAEAAQIYQVKLATKVVWEKVSVNGAASLAHALGLYDTQLVVEKAQEPSSTLMSGDRITAINGVAIADVFELQSALEKQAQERATVTVQRAGMLHEVTVALKPVTLQEASGKAVHYELTVQFMGKLIPPVVETKEYSSLWGAVGYGLETTAENVTAIVDALWGLVTGSVPLQNLGGPVMISYVAGQAAEYGFEAFFRTIALVSINIGLVNLFPIPVLDGGQIVLVCVEAIRRRRLSEITVENFQKIGFVLVLALVVLATYNDISRFWTQMLGGIAKVVK